MQVRLRHVVRVIEIFFFGTFSEKLSCIAKNGPQDLDDHIPSNSAVHHALVGLDNRNDSFHLFQMRADWAEQRLHKTCVILHPLQ